MNKLALSFMTRAKSALVFLFLLFLFACSTSANAADESLIVCTKAKAKVDAVRAELTSLGCTILSEIPFKKGKFTIFQVQPTGDISATVALIYKIKGISSVERTPQSTFQASGFCGVNDPDFPSQYGLQTVKWTDAICTMKLLGIGQRAIPRLTLIDSGCAKVNSGDEMNDVTQFNFVDGANGVPEFAFDAEVHGTAVCAIVGAKSDNANYIAGVGSHTLPVKIVSCRTSNGLTFRTIDVISAMVWCVDNQAARGGPGVVNISVNSFGLPKYNGSFVIQEIARNARLQGDLFVNASGNDSLVDSSPERFMRRVLALDENNLLASFSNTGPFKAAGPGVMIATFDSPNSIAFGTGTSFASQFWTGAICLLQSLNPALNAVDADAIVYRTAYTTTEGYKVPDIQKAVLRSALFPWM
ncbi:MAG: S8 family serine peptidase [Candidatus Obscuribacterales bacterium]|nr:S8 family serine peptidase [Candidatus Obscuribacterales bacterium]